MKAIGYVRCSTEEQSRNGVSLDAQRSRIRQWAEQHNARLVHTYTDEGVSGGAPIDKRPGLLAAIEAVGKDTVLVVVKRDRLARDAFLSAWLEKEVKRRHGRIISVAGEGTDSDNPADILMRRLVDAFSEYERAVIRARTKAALQHKRANGQRVGSVPYGFDLADDGTTLTENAAEQEVIPDIKAMRAQGRKLKQIASTLTERGIPTKTGKSTRWGHQAVARILARPE